MAEHARSDGSEAGRPVETPSGGHSTSEDMRAVDGTTAAPAPIAGARRRLSPRPVPVSRRRKVAAPVPGVEEEPTPAEEMGDVGKDDKVTGTEAAPPDDVNSGATATKTAKPKTAAEIVAEQKAREQAAASAGPESKPEETTVTKPVSRVSAASSAPPKPASGAVASKAAASKAAAGKQALGAAGAGVRKLRNLLASLIWLIAVLAAALLALGALFTALDQTNQSNEIVRWVLERGHDLVGPFRDLFRLETAKNTLLVNWGIAALVYLIAGKIIEKFVRP
ncbi:hypothetical protein GCM10009534_38700 [Kribbella sandramycini]|uniref:Uncharacterized protein n=1 Tax=Kribbella sandramycini TaxID=60450 RepID=A0A841SP18_9ACTN|nr:hypothetical protein [Kribbella sandramycini]